MSTTLIEQFLAYGLPFLALVVPGFFKRDGLSQEQNSWIACVALVILGGGQAYAAGQLGANPWVDFMAVTGGAAGLLAGPLNSFDQYIQSNIGLKSSPTPQSEEFTVPPPAPIILPNATKMPTDSPQPKQ